MNPYSLVFLTSFLWLDVGMFFPLYHVRFIIDGVGGYLGGGRVGFPSRVYMS